MSYYDRIEKSTAEEEPEYTYLEDGVRVIEAKKSPYGASGDCYLFHLDEMSEESRAKYGLTSLYERYKVGGGRQSR